MCIRDSLDLVCTPEFRSVRIWSRGCDFWCFHVLRTGLSSAWLCGDPGSKTVTGPVSVPILAPDSGLSVVLCCKHGSTDAPPVCSELCWSAIESGPVPDPSWEFLPFSWFGKQSFLVRPNSKSSSCTSFSLRELDSSNNTCTLFSTQYLLCPY